MPKHNIVTIDEKRGERNACDSKKNRKNVMGSRLRIKPMNEDERGKKTTNRPNQ